MLSLKTDATKTIREKHKLQKTSSQAMLKRDNFVSNSALETLKMYKSQLSQFTESATSQLRYHYYILTRLILSKRFQTCTTAENKKVLDTAKCSFCRQRWSAQASSVDTTALSHSSPNLSNSKNDCGIMTSHDISSAVTLPASIRSRKKTSNNSESLSSNHSKGSKARSVFRSVSRLADDVEHSANPDKPQLTRAKLPQRSYYNGMAAKVLIKDLSSLQRILSVLFTILILTTNVKAVWWSPGSNSNLVNSSRICQWARQVGGSQLEMCKHQPAVVEQIRLGIELGAEACQGELRNHRWNCTQVEKRSYARVMSQDTRETAFVHALTAAAITYQVTSACSRGLISECGCANNRRLKNRLLRLEAEKRNVTVDNHKLKVAVDNFEWGGCGDNVDYGISKSQEFLNFSRERNSRGRGALKQRVKEYNQEAGRMAIKNYRRRDCNCHGLSGSCTMWTCWKNMPRFSRVRYRLRSKYNLPVRVVGGNDGETLIPLRRRFSKRRRSKSTHKRKIRSTKEQRAISSKRKFLPRYQKQIETHPSRVRSRYSKQKRTSVVSQRLSGEDLIYTKRSPSFCLMSRKQGSLGTKGRLCEANKQGIGSCKYLCCGRGYRTVKVMQRRSENCRFQFCCHVKCDHYEENVTLHYCR